MRKIIIAIIIILVVIGGYIFIKDSQIKSELSKVEQAQEVENGSMMETESASTVTMARANGEWSVSETGEYTVDPSTIKFEFTGYKPGGQHVGTFNTMNATLGLDENGNPVNAMLSMDISSVKTDSDAVDGHLQTADFFDSAVNPKIEVKIASIEMTGDTSAQAITEITMKGVTKTVSMPITISKTDTGAKFMFDTRIAIGDFGIAYGPVLNEVRVAGEGEIVKK